MSNDESVAVTVGRIDENVKLLRTEQVEFKKDVKTSLANLEHKLEGKIDALENKFDGKNEMTQKDLNDLDKRVSALDEKKLDKSEFDSIRPLISILRWLGNNVGKIVVTFLVLLVLYAILSVVIQSGITP